jgi:hypothetical protein
VKYIILSPFQLLPFISSQYLLVAQASEDAQKKGRPGQLLDPRPETVDGGEMKIVITPQLVHDIFEAYPVVATAYAEVVPTLLAEAEFWRRYFQSKLYNAHRASIRSAAAQHVVKDDDIFDRYLEKDDDGMQRMDEEGPFLPRGQGWNPAVNEIRAFILSLTWALPVKTTGR